MTAPLAIRLADAVAALAELTEELAEAAYEAIESETLKQVAIGVGIDHTIEPTLIIEALGREVQRERDINRELRRQIAGLTKEKP